MVKNLAVKNNPERGVLIGDGLTAMMQVHNTQTRAAQADSVIEVNAELVRPAVTNHGQHPAEVPCPGRRARFQVDYAGNATHQSRPPFLILPESVLGSCGQNSTALGTRKSSR